MENGQFFGPCIDDLPMKQMVIFYSYDSLPEGNMVIYGYLT
jgi:hypothetical protein